MRLEIDSYELPEVIDFNYKELKCEIAKKISEYTGLVYTDEQIKEAKADRATLNKLKKALNDERIKREKEYMVPFNEFKSKINEIIKMIDEPVCLIDSQIKDYEKKKQDEKLEEIESYWAEVISQDERIKDVDIDLVFDHKWLNASTKIEKIKEEIDSIYKSIQNDLEALLGLEYGFEATKVYISTLDMSKALYEGKRIAEIAKEKEMANAASSEDLPGQVTFTDVESFDNYVKEFEQESEIEEKPADITTDSNRQWINFSAYLSTDEALKLKDFFNNLKISFKPL